MGLATEAPEVFPFGGKGCKGIGVVPRLIPGSEEPTWLGPWHLSVDISSWSCHSLMPTRQPPTPGACQACFHLRDFALAALSTWIIPCPVICMAHSLISFRSLLTTDPFKVAFPDHLICISLHSYPVLSPVLFNTFY